MRKHIVKIFLIFGISMVAVAAVPPTSAEKQFDGFVNELSNPGFENGTAGWTATTTAPAVTTTSGEVFEGTRALEWNPVGADNLSSPTWTVKADASGKAVAFMRVKTSDADYDIQVYDGTNVVATIDAPVGTDFSFVALNFTALESTTYRIRVSASGDESEIWIDKTGLGYANGINVGAQIPREIYSAYVSDADAVSQENEDWINGNCTNATAGQATCNFNSGIFTSPPNCFVQGHDSATNRSCDILSSSATASSVTVECRNTNTGGGSNEPFYLSCQKTGVDAKETVTVETSGSTWSGYHDSTCSWSRINTSYGDPNADATCTFVESINDSFGTVSSHLSGSDKLPGIVFTPKVAGAYKVCANIGSVASGSTSVQLGISMLLDSTTIEDVVFERGTASIPQLSLCGLIKVNSVSSSTIKLQTKAASSSIQLNFTGAGRAISWSIYPVSQSLPAPLFTELENIVKSGEQGVKIYSARISHSGTPTVASEIGGDWISSLSDNATGDSTVNITSGFFTAAPACTCSVYEAASSHICTIDATTAVSSTAVRVKTYSTTPALVDRGYMITCVGL